MKNGSQLLRFASKLLLSVCLFFSSCRTKDNDNTVVTPEIKQYGALTVKVSNEVNRQPIVFGSYNYTNSAGNLYKIDVLKYYISNFTLIRSDSSEINFYNHKLLNASDPESCMFTFDSVANGTYKAVRFYLGIDSAHNHTGLQEGDLDPINGMIWTWRTGYVFFKHEGNFINDTGGNSILLYHYGADDGLTTVDIPTTQFEVKGNSHTLFLKFDLNTLYNAPNVINFNNNNIHQSNGLADIFWFTSIKTNFPTSFTFDKVQ